MTELVVINVSHSGVILNYINCPSDNRTPTE